MSDYEVAGTREEDGSLTFPNAFRADGESFVARIVSMEPPVIRVGSATQKEEGNV